MKKLFSLLMMMIMVVSVLAIPAWAAADDPIVVNVIPASSANGSSAEGYKLVQDWILENTGVLVNAITLDGTDDTNQKNALLNGTTRIDVWWDGNWMQYKANDMLKNMKDYIDLIPNTMAYWANYGGLMSVTDKDGNVCTLDAAAGGFDYKKSPFQTNGGIILEGIFAPTGGNAEALGKEMEGYEADRRSKGHFAYPCAGSVFKNNRAFGLPSGKIIDNLGLRGYTVGGAKISEHHANIIVNSGHATAQDVKDLVSLVEDKVREATGFQLEREIIYV